ncbi:MAG: hypothetical protein A2660_00430 [Candidatus Doudnabacteria bacterium RIFCSPHIGHO2_01_FULL_45_18]|uniref:Uncharacterized protein n=1 Tax=Candidatus Doudnabacteria bacterium RIFCSPHIGHO2_01_FULL_45_18 TaxID=1817823 RepID=A0A1F5NQE2_9BACT|nr:MAG: hypothetical protein A2660_00430 [Candidatus Doudnabacteria bacterium RIFCSPHIGHO2_01_FULL_45_18]
MHTDYQKINSFEVATVVVIAVGFLLVGAMLFASFTPRAQTQVAAAFRMLDVHQDFNATLDEVKFIASIPNKFNQEFYLAFTQVAVLPVETFTRPQQTVSDWYQALANYSDQVAGNYLAVVSVQPQISGEGKILGTMIDRLATIPKVWSPVAFDNCRQSEPVPEVTSKPNEFIYTPPDVRSVESGLRKILNIR